MKTLVLFTLTLFLCSNYIFSQDLPFQETKGFGTDQLAGTNGDVYKVTTLAKDGPGSLQSFIKLSGPRIIVFEVGGIIDLDETDLTISNGSLTIAGQTAPYPGITIIKGGLKVRADNVVVQHLTIRPGNAGRTTIGGWEPDGFNVTKKNVVFDHCSVSWAIDENMSVSSGGNYLTFYRCIIAEGLSHSIHSKDEHSCGTLIMDGSKHISIFGCLYAHNYRRHPRLKTGTEALYANNVVYNYGIYAAHIGGEQGDGYSSNPGQGSFIGNTFLKGPDGWDNYFIEGHKGDFVKTMNPGNGMAYLEDNIMLDRTTGDTLIPHDEHITILQSPVALPTEFQAFPARENLEKVLKYAGSRPAERSDVDTRIIQTVIDGTGSIIDSQTDVGGYPSYTATSRTLTVPSGTDNIKVWLDSISVTLEENKELDATDLLDFVDNHYTETPTTPENPETPVTPNSISAFNSMSHNLKCYPNPVLETATITFSVKKQSNIQIKLFNLLGKEIAIIKDKAYTPGQHYFTLKPSDYNLLGGIYILRIQSNKGFQTIKLNIL